MKNEEIGFKTKEVKAFLAKTVTHPFCVRLISVGNLLWETVFSVFFYFYFQFFISFYFVSFSFITIFLILSLTPALK